MEHVEFLVAQLVGKFFFFREFQPMVFAYHQSKTPISFWYRRRLNLRSLIQPSEILPIELTETHY